MGNRNDFKHLPQGFRSTFDEQMRRTIHDYICVSQAYMAAPEYIRKRLINGELPFLNCLIVAKALNDD